MGTHLWIADVDGVVREKEDSKYIADETVIQFHGVYRSKTFSTS